MHKPYSQDLVTIYHLIDLEVFYNNHCARGWCVQTIFNSSGMYPPFDCMGTILQSPFVRGDGACEPCSTRLVFIYHLIALELFYNNHL